MKDRGFLDSLSTREATSVAPVVLQRWLTGTHNPIDVMLVNEYVNPYVFTLASHKKLLWLLLTTCGNKSTPKRQWLAPAKRQIIKPLTVQVLVSTLSCSESDAVSYLPMVEKEQILDAAATLGWQADQIKKLDQELCKA